MINTTNLTNFWRNPVTYRTTSTGMNANVMRTCFLPPSLSQEETGEAVKAFLTACYRPAGHSLHFRRMVKRHVRELNEFGFTYIDAVFFDRFAEVVLRYPKDLQIRKSGGYFELSLSIRNSG